MRINHITLAAAVLCLLAVPLLAGEPPSAEPPLTAILGAMQAEIVILTQALEEPAPLVIQKLKFTTGKLNGRRVVVAKMGIGKVNAAFMAALILERFKPAEVLVTGIAGGINADLGPGDIVIAEKIAHHDFGDLTAEGLKPKGVRNPVTGERNPIFFPANEELLKLADTSASRVKFAPLKSAAGERAPKIVKGCIVTGDMFVADETKRAALRKDFNADAVEMEGVAVAQVCHQVGVPCLVIRSISDSADANAAKDAISFRGIAAANSASLIREILTELVAQPPKK